MKERIQSLAGFVIVLTLSLLLLVYVGFGEVNRIYPTFQFDKLAAQGEIIKNSIDSYLKSGLPLKGFIGFSTLTGPLLKSDESITQIQVNDQTGVLFRNTGKNIEAGITDKSTFHTSVFSNKKNRFKIYENDFYYRIELELRNKFESVGFLTIDSPKSLISGFIQGEFAIVVQWMGALIILFGMFYLIFAKRFVNQENRFLKISFAAAFLVMSVIVVLTIVNIYSVGIKGKTTALGVSLAERLGQVVELGLDLNDFEGLSETFNEYKKINPDISDIGLTDQGKILIHTDADKRGEKWEVNDDQYVVDAPLKKADTYLKMVHVGIPKNVIYSKLARSIKNFVVLFAASGFLAFLFLNILTTFKSQNKVCENVEEEVVHKKTMALELIKPVYFLAVFIEGLHTSFLPQLFKEITVSSGWGENATSILFTIFFASFALTLIPSGNYAQRNGSKKLMVWGILLTSLLQFLTAFCTDYYLMILIRIFAGIGQGMLFIGVQSFILKNTVRGKKTQGAAIIVFGYNGGVISGASIGGLLIGSLGLATIFYIEAVIGLLCAAYIIKYIQEKQNRRTKTRSRTKEETIQGIHLTDREKTIGVGKVINEMLVDIGKVLKDMNFFRTLMLIGMPTKAVLTGVVVFAIPLLLTNIDYVKEDIGQIIMFYAAGVLISSRYASRLSDRIGKTDIILFFGSIGGGLGLILIGLSGWNAVVSSEIPFLSIIILIIGMSILGFAHGFVHAPIVTHISQTSIANQIGVSSTTSVYRFLERIGHVAGPVIVGQILIMTGYSLLALCWIGLAFVVFGILFMLGRKSA